MRLAGDIIIGPHHIGDTRNFVLSRTSPKLVVYDTAELEHIHSFAAYSGAYSEASRGNCSPFIHPWTDDSPFPDANYSAAPLENVTYIHIFHNGESGLCRGMLLGYQNGARRVVGECRVGVDPVEICASPAAICFIRTTYFRPGTRVERRALRVKVATLATSDHSHGQDGWVCHRMRGNLEFWFTAEQSSMNVIIDE